MKNSRKMTCALAGILLSSVLTPAAASANVGSSDSSSVHKTETITQADGGTLTITKMAVTAEDFPVIPDVGESVTFHDGDTEVLVETIAAGCTISRTISTPIKQHNRVQSTFTAEASSGCAGGTYVSGQTQMVNYGGGWATHGSNSMTVSPGGGIRFVSQTGTCANGWDKTWQGYSDGAQSQSVTLPCGF